MKCDKCNIVLKVDKNFHRHKVRTDNYVCDECEPYSPTPCVYAITRNDKIIYIGHTQNVVKRTSEHFHWTTGSLITEYLVPTDEVIILEEIDNKRERLIREFELIAQHKPQLNYPYRNE